MPTRYLSITPAAVAKLVRGDPAAAPNTFVRDVSIPGFAVLIGRTKSSYVVEGRAGRYGRNVRMTLGTVGRLTLDDARIMAREKLAALARGEHVVEVARAAARAKAIKSLTLSDALRNLLAARALRERTRKDYIDAVDRELVEWKDRPLSEITTEMVTKRWSSIPGKTSAARAMRIFRAVWNHAKANGADLGEPPTRILKSVSKGWAIAPRRRRLIADGIMPAWRKAVDGMENEGMRDLVLFMLFTGARISEARALTAADVNLRAGTFRIQAPKNKRPVDLPIVKQLVPVLERRLAAAPHGPIFTQDRSSYWLKPTLEVCQWSWHDLRRGYITAAHRVGIDPDVARALTNHVVAASDAHGGYVVLSADAMRADAQKVADFIDRLGRARGGEVVSLRRG